MADPLYDRPLQGLICVCLLYYTMLDSREASWGASALKQEEMMVFESTGAVSYLAHHPLSCHVALFGQRNASCVYRYQSTSG